MQAHSIANKTTYKRIKQMKGILNDQKEFMLAAGQFVHEQANTANVQSDLYGRLVIEEQREMYLAAQDEDICEFIKEACDCIVVTAGMLISMIGYEKAEKAWELVHASNMAKTTGVIEKREDGKVLKSAEWKAEIKSKLMQDIQELIDA